MIDRRLQCLAVAALVSGTSSCTEAECATPDYTRAECRVLAENEFARKRTSTGIELRMQDPAAEDADTWIAAGLIRERGQQIEVRVATLGDFAISLQNPGDEPVVVDLVLANVHPDVELELGPDPVVAEATGTKRRLAVPIDAGALVWLRGRLPCVGDPRILALGDVQTNPTQFARIIERIEQEVDDADAAGERLVGVVMPGDLTEFSSEAEFRVFGDLLESIPVPFALTPGNHDVYESHLPFYNQNFGPGNYDFEVCGVHVAMLDTGSGAVAHSVIGRLNELFDRGDAEHSIAVMHHPPYSATTAAGWKSEDLAMLTLGEFALQGGDLVIAGHAHMIRDFQNVPIADRDIRELIVGTAGAWQGAGNPIYGYVRLRFADAPISACFVEVPPPGAQASASLPGEFAICDQP